MGRPSPFHMAYDQISSHEMTALEDAVTSVEVLIIERFIRKRIFPPASLFGTSGNKIPPPDLLSFAKENAKDETDENLVDMLQCLGDIMAEEVGIRPTHPSVDTAFDVIYDDCGTYPINNNIKEKESKDDFLVYSLEDFKMFSDDVRDLISSGISSARDFDKLDWLIVEGYLYKISKVSPGMAQAAQLVKEMKMDELKKMLDFLCEKDHPLAAKVCQFLNEGKVQTKPKGVLVK